MKMTGIMEMSAIHAQHPQTNGRKTGKECNELENLHSYVLIQIIFVILHVELVYVNLHNP